MKAKVKAKKAKSVKTIKPAGDGEATKGSKVRKQDKQLRFITKLQDNQVLSVKKTIGKKRKRTREKAAKALGHLGNLSSLLESLPTQEEIIASPLSFKKKSLTRKSHQKVVVKETKQLAAVLSHPEFKTDPFAAIQQHLTNTLPAPDPPVKKQAGRGKKQKKPRRKDGDDLMDE